MPELSINQIEELRNRARTEEALRREQGSYIATNVPPPATEKKTKWTRKGAMIRKHKS